MRNLQIRWTLALLGLSGVLALFFPFADGYDIKDGWDWLGPFILPVVAFPLFISIGQVALIVADRPPRWMNPAGYAAAVLISAIAISDFLEAVNLGDVLFDDVIATFASIPAICILAGTFRWLDAQAGAKGLVALQSIYAVHLSFYLTAFLYSSHQVGYWLVTLALAVSLAQIVVFAEKLWRIILLVLPTAVFWIWIAPVQAIF